MEAKPLFEPLPRDIMEYCVDVTPVQRLMVRIDASGKLLIKGQRAEIEALLALLSEQGVTGELSYLSFCG